MSDSQSPSLDAGLLAGSPALHDSVPISTALMGAVFFVSLALLSLQLVTARLLSAVLSHHYVFAILSLAMLGLGLGGVLTHLFHVHARHSRDNHKRLIVYGLLTACSIPATVGGIIWMAGQAFFYDHVIGYFVVVLLPFLVSGLFFAEVYQQYSQWAGRVYAFDLIGAAAGGGFSIAVLNSAGGIGSTFFLSALVALATAWLAFSARPTRHRLGSLATIVLLASLSAGLMFGHDSKMSEIPNVVNPDKEIYDAIHGPWRGEISDTRWSAFGRTQLITYRDNPDHRDIYIDGTAGTPMYQFSGDFSRPGQAVQKLFDHFPGAVPFQFIPRSQRNNALIIGPGGGRDILLTAGAGFTNIVAAEVNPDLLDLVHEHSAYNGGLYTDFDHIMVHRAEGRHFIQRDQTKYDLIMMSLPVTNTSRSREGFSLTENYLLTEQALGDYLNHLSDQGQLIIITHDELAVVRLLRITLDALAQRGLDATTAMQHVYVLGSFPYPIVVIGKQAFSADTARHILQQIHSKDYSMAASYVPHMLQPGTGNPMLQALAQGHLSIPGMVDYVAGHGHDISAVTDNRPFFYKTESGLPKSLKVLAGTASGVAILALALPILFGLRRPAHIYPQAQKTRQRFFHASLVFSILGMGFMLVEISLMQRLTFFLGEPVLALAVLLGALLVFMAAGSLLSSRISLQQTHIAMAVIAVSIAALSMACMYWLPGIMQSLLVYDLPVRVLCAIGLIMPLGILLGSPFPLALRIMHLTRAPWAVPWMWAINGVFSVLGATGAIVITMLYGLDQVLLAATGSYLLLACVATYPLMMTAPTKK